MAWRGAQPWLSTRPGAEIICGGLIALATLTQTMPSGCLHISLGGIREGRFDPQGMRHMSSIDVDAKGRV